MISTNSPSISGLLALERIRVGLEASGKAEAINSIVGLLKGMAEVNDLDQLRADVFEREALLSTGVGRGLALPHARTSAVSDTLMALAISRRPIDYGALDGEPVRMLVLLVGPEEEHVLHVRLMGRISRLMNDAGFRSRLLAAESADSVLDMFQQAEEAYG